MSFQEASPVRGAEGVMEQSGVFTRAKGAVAMSLQGASPARGAEGVMEQSGGFR